MCNELNTCFSSNPINVCDCIGVAVKKNGI